LFFSAANIQQQSKVHVSLPPLIAEMSTHRKEQGESSHMLEMDFGSKALGLVPGFAVKQAPKPKMRYANY
jgi:hypothetical protein